MTYCCEKCFKDAHIIKTIRQNGTLGNCDFCSSKNIPVIDISYSNPVSDMMIKIGTSVLCIGGRKCKANKRGT